MSRFLHFIYCPNLLTLFSEQFFDLLEICKLGSFGFGKLGSMFGLGYVGCMFGLGCVGCTFGLGYVGCTFGLGSLRRNFERRCGASTHTW